MRPAVVAILGFFAGCNAIIGLELGEPEGAGASSGSVSSGAGGTGAPCAGNASCDDDNPCTDDACDFAAGTCVATPIPDGDVPGTPDPADDCVNPRCVSGVSTDVPDDSEVPDDGNECTDDTCQDGAALNAPKAAGTPCAAGACNAMGQCAGCRIPDDCGGQDTFCSLRTCINELCGLDNQPQGTPLPDGDQTDGDCVLRICDANGGATLTGNGNDTPPDDGNPCTDGVCINDQPVQDPIPAGEPCGLGNVCDGSGNCGECVDNTDCNAPETCGGGGVMNQCGCTPTTCAALGVTCGMVPNGCGTMLNCNDGITNGNETDVDCGGGAPPGGTCAVDCAIGDTCAGAGDCTSGFCADGVCCNVLCNGVCKSCNFAASPGTCSNTPQFVADAPLCTGTMTCNGGANNACRLIDGQPCTVGNDCASGNCIGNICE
jgi:hypothetical protein